MTERDTRPGVAACRDLAAQEIGAFLAPFVRSATRADRGPGFFLKAAARYMVFLAASTHSLAVRLHRQSRLEQDLADAALGRLLKDLKPVSLRPTKAEVKSPSFNLTPAPTSVYFQVAMFVGDHPRRQASRDVAYDQFEKSTADLLAQTQHFTQRVVLRQFDDKREQRRQRVYGYACLLSKVVKKLRQLGLTAEELLTARPFPKKPFEREYSEAFMRATRKNDLKAMRELLALNKYLVFAFDWSLLTPLHWAAKRGYSEALLFLADRGADLDAEDALGKPAIWYALHLNHAEALALLLARGAAFPKSVSLRHLQKLKVHPLLLRAAKTLLEARCCACLLPRGAEQRAAITAHARAAVVALLRTSGLFKLSAF